MNTSTDSLNLGRFNRTRRRNNVRQNWSRIIQLFLITLTIFACIFLLVITLWLVPRLVAWVFPATEKVELSQVATEQVETMLSPELAHAPPQIVQVEDTQTATPTTIPILADMATPSATFTPEPTATSTETFTPVPSLTPTATPAPFCISSPGQGYVAIQLRSGPYLPRNVSLDLGSIAKGDSVRILSKHTNYGGLFYKVVTSGGQIGWVPATICMTEFDMTLVPHEPVDAVPTQLPIIQYQSSPTSDTSTVNVPQNQSNQGSGNSQDIYFRASVTPFCDENAIKTWFDGHIFVNGVPVNGYQVWFGSRLGGEQFQQIAGPHEGYWDWQTGYYAHIVDDPRKEHIKHLRVWLTDDMGNQISNDAEWDTNCAYTRIDFTSP